MPPIPALALSAVPAIGALAAPSATQAQDTRFYINDMTGTTITHVSPASGATEALISLATRSWVRASASS